MKNVDKQPLKVYIDIGKIVFCEKGNAYDQDNCII